MLCGGESTRGILRQGSSLALHSAGLTSIAPFSFRRAFYLVLPLLFARRDADLRACRGARAATATSSTTPVATCCAPLKSRCAST